MRPFTHGLPKAAMPFLNLPLLSLGWFYLERMGMTGACLNSHLFPEKLAKTLNFLCRFDLSSDGAPSKTPVSAREGGAAHGPQAKHRIVFEPESLNSAGGLYNAMRRFPAFFNEAEDFFYLNGDSLFFPSSLEALAGFVREFREGEAEGLFFGAPFAPGEPVSGCFWIDSAGRLRAIGSAEKARAQGHSPSGLSSFKDSSSGRRASGFSGPESRAAPGGGSESFAGRFSLKNLKPGRLLPVKFSGLALFKGRFLRRLSEKNLSPENSHIFRHVMEPLLEKGIFRVFADPGGMVLEGGEKPGYLQATGLAMRALFSDLKTSGSKAEGQAALFPANPGAGLKSLLEDIFRRFDPEDKIAGLRAGRKWAAAHGTPLLAPASVQGLEHLRAEGFCVIGPGTAFTGDSFLKESVLGLAPWSADSAAGGEPGLKAAGICWRGALEREVLIKFSS